MGTNLTLSKELWNWVSEEELGHALKHSGLFLKLFSFLENNGLEE